MLALSLSENSVFEIFVCGPLFIMAGDLMENGVVSGVWYLDRIEAFDCKSWTCGLEGRRVSMTDVAPLRCRAVQGIRCRTCLVLRSSQAAIPIALHCSQLSIAASVSVQIQESRSVSPQPRFLLPSVQTHP